MLRLGAFYRYKGHCERLDFLEIPRLMAASDDAVSLTELTGSLGPFLAMVLILNDKERSVGAIMLNKARKRVRTSRNSATYSRQESLRATMGKNHLAAAALNQKTAIFHSPTNL